MGIISCAETSLIATPSRLTSQNGEVLV